MKRNISEVTKSESVAKKAKVKKKKVALLVAYNGEGYYCLQMQKEHRTVESVLEEAIYKAGGITEANHGDLHKIGWQRSCRTGIYIYI